MQDIIVRVQKLKHYEDLPLPSYRTLQSACVDLFAAIPKERKIELKRFKRALIPTGIAIALPENFEAQIRPRSGLALKFGVTIINTPGTIDADYRGEIMIPLINLGEEDYIIERGMRIAQMLVAPVTKINWSIEEEIEQDTQRGVGGFGSTGF
ncbi:MAG: dUTP diphosphatase [Proteobacteria bacterium]|nr:dUTP diphosphatase [Pseudomonadota bacterium]